jgi:uncharacterized protein YbjT (DUF2867 family)
MASPILVTGGTGTLGRSVVQRLQDAGREVRVLSRSTHPAAPGVEQVTGDLIKDVGIEGAVDGVGVIVNCAGSAKHDQEQATSLVRAARRAGTPHLIYVSVVGADRVPVTSSLDRTMFGYFRAKQAAEQIVADSGLPWTTLRASQFYQSLLLVARKMTRLPVIPVPAGVRFQPIDADEVAARLVELALGPPAGLLPDMAGPRVYGLAELVQGYLRASNKRRVIIPLGIPGKAARALRAGANLAPQQAVGLRTWEEFLAQTVGAPPLPGTKAAGN